MTPSFVDTIAMNWDACSGVMAPRGGGGEIFLGMEVENFLCEGEGGGEVD